MSARMKSSSADPDFVRISFLKVAIEASLSRINSVTMAGSVSIGAGATPAGPPIGPSSGRVATKSPRSRIVRRASPISGSDLSNTSR